MLTAASVNLGFRTKYETTIKAADIESQPGSSPTGASKQESPIQLKAGSSNIVKDTEGLGREHAKFSCLSSQLNPFQNERLIQRRSSSSLKHKVVKEDLPYRFKSSPRLAALPGLIKRMNSMTSTGDLNRLSPLSCTYCQSTSTAFLRERFLFHYSSLERNSTKEDSSNNSFLPEQQQTKAPTFSNNNRLFRRSSLSRFVLPPRKRTMNLADLPSANELAKSDRTLQFSLPMCSRQLTETLKELPSNQQQEQKSIAPSMESQNSSMKCNVGLTFELNQLLEHCSEYKSGQSIIHNGSCSKWKANKTEGSCFDLTGDCRSSTNLEDFRFLRDHSKDQLLGVIKCRGFPLKGHQAQEIFERQSRLSRTKHIKHHKSGQILNTPSPVRPFDCFQNGSNGEDVEEPIVFVPNYFMDLETEPNCKMLSQDNNSTTSKATNGERPIEDKDLKRRNKLYGMRTMDTCITDVPEKRDACFQVVNNQSGLYPSNTDYEKIRTQEHFSVGSLSDDSIDSTLKDIDVSEKREQEEHDKLSWAHKKRNLRDSLHIIVHKECSELFGDCSANNNSDRFSSCIRGAFPSTSPSSPVKTLGLRLNCGTSTKLTDAHSTLDKMKNAGNITHKCKECDQKTGTFSNFTHNSTALHTVEMPHVCQHCSKIFKRSSNLKAHLRTHSHVKPYKCEFCDKTFHQKIDMKIHRYTHTGEKPHKCSTCGRGFKQLTHLAYHMRTHSDVKIFNCEFCGKGFNQKSNLQAHIYGHTGERPHRCEVCHKSFTLTSTLNTHRRTHAVTKPFECGICHKAFYQKNALKTHYISSHPLVNGVCLL